MLAIDTCSQHWLANAVLRRRRRRIASRWLQGILVAILVCLGLLKAASAGTDDIEGCVNAFDLKDAVTACTKIIESNWANNHQLARAFNNRANANAALGLSEIAIEDYSRALAIDPHYGNALYNRGSAYLEMGELDLAIADLDAVLKIDAQRAEAHNNRGLALARLGDTAAAIADFVTALEINPALASVHNNLGLARRKTGDYARAIADFSRAMELKPNYAAALNNRGEVLFIEHRYAEA
ncbi:MAG TPA: tetratricopeptide repeat protein, partial [Steroidobacteraceae bacterium]|nr:tetratricopeptide repeat protein [Steroidobacteraceae bacterium]